MLSSVNGGIKKAVRIEALTVSAPTTTSAHWVCVVWPDKDPYVACHQGCLDNHAQSCLLGGSIIGAIVDALSEMFNLM
ncbi:hypothetical protein MRX96_057825 [Rhipicephalus microplus]